MLLHMKRSLLVIPSGHTSRAALRKCMCPRQAAFGTSHQGSWVGGEDRSKQVPKLHQLIHVIALLTLGPQM